ncbi:DUF3108 domain-containing protein [Solimonas marina]|uniref:DUF3108 domain-containing protein n=1 Tax=Solimonas marina TaxID=2714601 RepID=A0A970B9S2_9GAMM|nr:DUF3108 domain-containing protein [Solimonas marina]NKF23649.1 DUF3108 domain-containing protein [Solimonas marina]
MRQLRKAAWLAAAVAAALASSSGWAQKTDASGDDDDAAYVAPTPATEAATQAADSASATKKVDASFWAARADKYTVQWGGISLGDGVITLTPVGKDCYEYRSETDPVALVRWTYGSPSETSQFCLRDGDVYPTHFEYKNGKSDDNFTVDFDAANHRAKIIRGGEVNEFSVPTHVYDAFSIQEAVRFWAARNAANIGAEHDFAFVDKKKLRSYTFKIQGKETVDTPAGSFETLLVERVDNPNKSYRYWLAPSRDYIPVRIKHINKGKTELQMALEK